MTHLSIWISGYDAAIACGTKEETPALVRNAHDVECGKCKRTRIYRAMTRKSRTS